MNGENLMGAITLKYEKMALHLESLYRRFNKRELVAPDPLQFLYGWESPRDAEIVGLIASSLAYGRVAMILRSISAVLEPMGHSPFEFVMSESEQEWRNLYANFKHRFTDGEDVAALLSGIQNAVTKWGSLEACFAECSSECVSLTAALDIFIERLSLGRPNSLLALPRRGSACKRHFLFLRWMVRRDEVDVGCWRSVSPSELLVPLDTHMYQICSALGFTRRKSADLKTAEEITECFRALCPSDPVRYDFTLTRFGIRSDMDYQQLFGECGADA